ncbi:MAG: LamG domain-containing protein [Planctomycetes bacterium]|nr:LamG domain-containing protein [Planctomycetota bacterium]
MCRKLFLLISVVLLLVSVIQAEDIKWTDLGADHLWSTPENWDLGRVPALDDEVLIDVPAAAAPNGPIIQDGIDAKAKGLWTEAPGEPMLTITGGTLEVAEWIWWGDGADSFGIMDMSGGTLTTGSEFELGWGGGAGTLTMTGGTISAFEAVIPTGSGAFGELFLYGGTYNVTKAGGLEVNANGIIDITEGTLVLEGDDTVKINDLIAAGSITAFGGDGEFELDFDGRNPGKTTLTATIEKAVLFAEDFEGLTLGPNIDETLAGEAVWTDTPPEGWSVDESGIPGIGMDATDGVTEWAGWAFADKAWWIEAAEDQNRSQFELASGIVAVADPDEWDDDERLPIPIDADPYDTWLTTPEIKISAAEPGTLELKFDSSWRPEFDDNYHQTANITASFDGGDPVEVLLWESDGASANFHPDATNETIIVNLDNPEGARNVVLTFGLFDAGNDWWWAIDNIEVRGVVLSQEPVDPGTDGLVASYALDGDATDSSGNGNDGIIHNAETGGLGDGGSVWVDDPERGTVISFNGTADGAHVRAGDIPQMTLTNDFTWSFWAKQNAENTANNDIILGNRMDENAVDFVPRQFIKFTPTKFEWHMNGNGDDNMEYDDIPADIWLHHAVVKTGDQLTYYRNGAEGGSGIITQPLDFPQPLFFGGDNEGSAGENWGGLMSDVSIYDRALSVGEVMFLADLRAIPVDPGTDGLAAAYVFEADAADSSGNALDGTLLGDAHVADGVLVLDGDDDAVAIPGIGEGLTEFTFSMMVHPTVDVTPLQFSGGINTDSWGGGVHLKLNNGNVNVGVNGLAGGDVVGTSIVEPDMWTHLALTVSPEEVAVYVNGEKEGSRTGETVPAVNVVALAIGAWNNGGTDVQREMTGMMDDVLIYDRALSAGEVRYLAGFRSVKINFQQTGGDVPEGYLPDGGEVFGDRGNGYSYGWNIDSTGGARNRNNPDAPDERYDTTQHLEKGEHRIWEIELPNGTYDLLVACGDVNHTDQINNMDVEGTVLLDPDGEDNFDEYELMVDVADGRLTIQMAEGASNAKIMFVDIN